MTVDAVAASGIMWLLICVTINVRFCGKEDIIRAQFSVALAVLCASCIAGLVCEASGQTHGFLPNPIEKPGWSLVVHDEFDGDKLNEGLWIPEYFPGRFKEPKRARIEIKDGVLLIHDGPGIQTYNCHDLHKIYANPSEKVQTVDKFKQLYGFYEIRAKHSTTAHHIAFWVLEAKPHGAEIDITEDEGYGGPNWHIPAARKIVHKRYDDITTHRQRCEEFHIYALEVQEKGVRIYHDNQVLEEVEVEWKERGEMPLMFLLGIYENKPDGQPYAIDYFRAFRKADDQPQNKSGPRDVEE